MFFALSIGVRINYVLFVGEKELKSKKLKLKDMSSGKESNLGLNGIIKRLI